MAAYDQWLLASKTAPTPIPYALANEIPIDEYLVAQGRKVEPNLLGQEWVGGAAGKQGDRFVDGVKTEYKAFDDVFAEQTDDILSDRIATVLNRKPKQADVFILDARNQPGLTEEIAKHGASRAWGALLKNGHGTQQLRILGPNGIDYTSLRPGS